MKTAISEGEQRAREEDEEDRSNQGAGRA